MNKFNYELFVNDIKLCFEFKYNDDESLFTDYLN